MERAVPDSSSPDLAIDRGDSSSNPEVSGRRWRAVLFDVLAVTVTGWIWLTWGSPWTSWRSAPRHWYVSPLGSLFSSGHSPTSPSASLQGVLDQVQPGDEVVLLPGVYRQRLHLRQGGVAGKPVVVRARNPGTVLVTAAEEGLVTQRRTWREVAPGIYATSIDWSVAAVQADGEWLYRVPWGGVTALQKLAQKPAAWGAFCWEQGVLTVALKHGQDPRTVALQLPIRTPPPREWGETKAANLTIEANWIELRDLRFSFGIGSNVLLWGASHVEIEGCEFTGATVGVRHGGRGSASDVSVRNSIYHFYPQAEWLRGWLDWHEVYAAYSSSTLVQSSQPAWTVERCLIAQFGDAIRVSPAAAAVGDNPDRGSRVQENVIVGGTDDAFEFDGDGRHLQCLKNLVVDAHETLSCSPLVVGPVEFRRNVAWHPRGGLNGANLKFLPPKVANRRLDPVRNVEVTDNTFVGNWLCWSVESVEAIKLSRNRFVVEQTTDPPWPAAVAAHENRLLSRAEVAEPDELTGLNEWKIPRPGPKWLDWKQLPATRKAADTLRRMPWPQLDWLPEVGSP